jgi:hypothetical protein
MDELPKTRDPTITGVPLTAKSTVLVSPPTVAVTVAAPELEGVAGLTATKAWPLFPVLSVVLAKVTAPGLVDTAKEIVFCVRGLPSESV